MFLKICLNICPSLGNQRFYILLVRSCSLVDLFQHFEETYRLHLQCEYFVDVSKSSTRNPIRMSLYCPKEAAFVASGRIRRPTRRHCNPSASPTSSGKVPNRSELLEQVRARHFPTCVDVPPLLHASRDPLKHRPD